MDIQVSELNQHAAPVPDTENPHWDVLKAVTHLPQISRPSCESCALRIESGGYKFPRLKGVYCSIRCLELQLASDSSCHGCLEQSGKPCGSKRRFCSDSCRKQAKGSLGDGNRLLDLLRRKHRDLHRKVAGGSVKRCQNCEGEVAHEKRADAHFCSEECRQSFKRLTRKTLNGGNSRIGATDSKAFTTSHFAGSLYTSSAEFLNLSVTERHLRSKQGAEHAV
jgi:hypothetical protein